MTENTEDIFKSMNATRVLIAVLNQIGSITIPTSKFLESNSEDRQLSVDYDNVDMSFTFKMQDGEVKQEDPKPEIKLTGRIY
jgi:hypothetical protein